MDQIPAEKRKKLEIKEAELKKEKELLEEREKKLNLIEIDLKKQADNIEKRTKKAEKLFSLSADKDDLQDFFSAVTDLYYKWCAENETGQGEFIRAVTHALELRKLIIRK